MAHGHKKVICIECDAVIGQCRCMTADKTITYEICNKCKAEGVTVVVGTEQQLREAKAREVYLQGQIRILEERILLLEKENAE